MGQYHILCNLTKKEFVNPHILGVGMKVWEQMMSFPSTGNAMVILIACPSARGGGDLGHNEVCGRWHGDRIALIGDYAEESDIKDLPEGMKANEIYGDCINNRNGWMDISFQVTATMEGMIGGKYHGDKNSWREFSFDDDGHFSNSVCECCRKDQEKTVKAGSEQAKDELRSSDLTENILDNMEE